MKTLQRTFRAGTILALAAVMALAISTACSNDEPRPTEEPDNTQSELMERLDRMSGDIAVLRREAEESGRQPAETAPLTTTPAPTAEAPTETATEAPAPTTAAPPTPSGPGICGRSPEIQREILDQIDVPLCQVTTTAELFRIEDLSSSLRMETVRSGDLGGLVNVKEMTLTARHLEPGGLSGLENLEELELTVYTDGSIAPGAFQDLNKLERLTIGTRGTSKPDTLTLPDFDHLPNLERLEIKEPITMDEASSPQTVFKNLPSLEHVIARIPVRDYNNSETSTVKVSGGVFKNNPSLKSVRLQAGHFDEISMELPEDLFSENPLLDEVRIEGNFRVPKNTFAHMENLGSLRLAGVVSNGERQEHEIVLHESSPLYNLITYGNEHPSGWELVEFE